MGTLAGYNYARNVFLHILRPLQVLRGAGVEVGKLFLAFSHFSLRVAWKRIISTFSSDSPVKSLYAIIFPNYVPIICSHLCFGGVGCGYGEGLLTMKSGFFLLLASSLRIWLTPQVALLVPWDMECS